MMNQSQIAWPWMRFIHYQNMASACLVMYNFLSLMKLIDDYLGLSLMLLIAYPLYSMLTFIIIVPDLSQLKSWRDRLYVFGTGFISLVLLLLCFALLGLILIFGGNEPLHPT